MKFISIYKDNGKYVINIPDNHVPSADIIKITTEYPDVVVDTVNDAIYFLEERSDIYETQENET